MVPNKACKVAGQWSVSWQSLPHDVWEPSLDAVLIWAHYSLQKQKDLLICCCVNTFLTGFGYTARHSSLYSSPECGHCILKDNACNLPTCLAVMVSRKVVLSESHFIFPSSIDAYGQCTFLAPCPDPSAVSFCTEVRDFASQMKLSTCLHMNVCARFIHHS